MKQGDRQEHIHIISSGASIHKTFPIAIKKSEDITKAVVIVEKEVLEAIPDNSGVMNQQKLEIQNSIDELKELAERLGVEYEMKVISHISLETIRDCVLEILEKHPNAKYYFNISGGTKVLSIGLFVMSLWLEGTAYHIDSSNRFQKLTVPKMHVKDISQNPNYVNILEILKRSPENKLSRIQLFEILENQYKPVRELKGKEERKLTGGVLTKLISSLIGWGLVEEGYKKGSKREKEYTITEDGLFALKFMKSQGDKINHSF